MVLINDKLAIGEFGLNVLISHRGVLTACKGISVVLPVNLERDGSGEFAESKLIVGIVAGNHKQRIGGGESTVEETVVRVTCKFCRPGCVEVACAVLADIRLKAIYGFGGLLAAVCNVSGGKSHGYLVLGVFTVNHNLVTFHPGGFEAAFGKDKCQGKGYGFNFLNGRKALALPFRNHLACLCAGAHKGRNGQQDSQYCKYLFHNLCLLN